MSLRVYRRPRMVVLHPDTPLLAAARALENNNIGAVFVQDAGSLVGILTDRDLAVRVVGQGLDPNVCTLSTVMSKNPVTLPPTSSREDALDLMRRAKVRRIPLVEDEKLVGIVTLDDLLLDEAASLDLISAVVQAQLGSGGPAASGRQPAARRRAARAEETYNRFLNQLQSETRLPSLELTETALEVVASSLIQRLAGGEAEDLISQLPSLLQPTLLGLPPGPNTQITKESIQADLVQRLDVDPDRADEILQTIGSEILLHVSEGESANVQGQLPPDLREVFLAPPFP